MRRTTQIDLLPERNEHGLWVVREEEVLGPDRFELLDEYFFLTRREADAFIHEWVHRNTGRKDDA